MEWIPIDRFKLPQEEVLGAIIDEKTGVIEELVYGYVLHLYRADPYINDKYETEVFITHYFDPTTLKIPKSNRE
jgi:hypothetical protein